jgi:hypothetical protein
MARMHHHETEFLEALKLLIESGKARTTADLVRYALQGKQVQAAEYLKELEAESIPLDLAFDALSVRVRMVAHKRNHSLLQSCAEKVVGLVLPLPGHILQAFSALDKLSVLIPDGRHSRHEVEDSSIRQIHGTRECRQAVGQLEVVVFEAFREGQTFLVDPSTSDIVDLRVVPSSTQLIVHLRPHKHPTDLPLNTYSRTLDVL